MKESFAKPSNCIHGSGWPSLPLGTIKLLRPLSTLAQAWPCQSTTIPFCFIFRTAIFVVQNVKSQYGEPVVCEKTRKQGLERAREACFCPSQHHALGRAISIGFGVIGSPGSCRRPQHAPSSCPRVSTALSEHGDPLLLSVSGTRVVLAQEGGRGEGAKNEAAKCPPPSCSSPAAPLSSARLQLSNRAVSVKHCCSNTRALVVSSVPAACCPLPAACSVLCAACIPLRAACSLLPAACSLIRLPPFCIPITSPSHSVALRANSVPLAWPSQPLFRAKEGLLGSGTALPALYGTASLLCTSRITASP